MWACIKDRLRPEARILESGCGNGKWLRALSRKGFEIYGIDFSDKALSVLHTNYPDSMVGRADVRDLPFRNECFDAILSWGVLEHIPEGPSDAIMESARCLRTRGQFFVTVPYLSWNRRFNPLVFVRRWLSKFDWIRTLTGRGPKAFFQYEYTVEHFMEYLIECGFAVDSAKPIWVDFGLEDDFRFLVGPMKQLMKFLHGISLGRSTRSIFASFILFTCRKR